MCTSTAEFTDVPTTHYQIDLVLICSLMEPQKISLRMRASSEYAATVYAHSILGDMIVEMNAVDFKVKVTPL